MKLKQVPEDFIVEEQTSTKPSERGPFALYRLEKIGWTTPDALIAIRRRWDIDSRRLSYGGLKDRHAKTTQHFTIYRGPQRNLNQQRLTVTYLGQTEEPFTSDQIDANRFTLTLRDFSSKGLTQALESLEQVRAIGLPNYFDDQRFGSVGHDGAFVAREMIRGDFESALRIALTGPYEFDRAAQKREKAILIEHWGQWSVCKSRLERGHARSLVDYLVHHPTDFRGAVARLRPDLQGLYLSAYQSHVWNRLLASWLRTKFQPHELATMELSRGPVPVPNRLTDNPTFQWDSTLLPLPSARIKPDLTAAWYPLVQAVLAEDGLTLETMKIPGMDRPYFTKGERTAGVRPHGIEATSATDERHPGRKKLELRFELPRGSYATLLVKRITSVSSEPGI